MSLEVPERAYMHALEVLRAGGVIAYPTEAVYGLGCDPFNEAACRKILALKERDEEQGMIVIASTHEQLAPLVTKVSKEREKVVHDSWPGPYTWLFPKSKKVPSWVSGTHSKIAVRIPDHPTARHLCELFGKPIISTSANKHGEDPAMDNLAVHAAFKNDVDYIVPGRVGDLGKPTSILDAETGRVIRECA